MPCLVDKKLNPKMRLTWDIPGAENCVTQAHIPHNTLPIQEVGSIADAACIFAQIFAIAKSEYQSLAWLKHNWCILYIFYILALILHHDLKDLTG